MIIEKIKKVIKQIEYSDLFLFRRKYFLGFLSGINNILCILPLVFVAYAVSIYEVYLKLSHFKLGGVPVSGILGYINTFYILISGYIVVIQIVGSFTGIPKEVDHYLSIMVSSFITCIYLYATWFLFYVVSLSNTGLMQRIKWYGKSQNLYLIANIIEQKNIHKWLYRLPIIHTILNSIVRGSVYIWAFAQKILLHFAYWEQKHMIRIMICLILFQMLNISFSKFINGTESQNKFFLSLRRFWYVFICVYVFLYPIAHLLSHPKFISQPSCSVFVLVQAFLLSCLITYIAVIISKSTDEKKNNLIKLVLGSLIFPIILKFI